jgi:hypothetical protein
MSTPKSTKFTEAELISKHGLRAGVGVGAFGADAKCLGSENLTNRQID